MKVMINGQPIHLTEQSTLAEALIEYKAKEPFAVALNGLFIARHDCTSTAVKEGDSIELLSPIQGG